MISEHTTLLEPPRQIVKRDGRTVSFDPTKIRNAVYRCLTHGLNWTAEVSGGVADHITARVVESLSRESETPTIEAVQDLVEYHLWMEGYQEAARNYIWYREERRLMREAGPGQTVRTSKRTRKRGIPEATFRLDDAFVERFSRIPPPWGFGVLSELTFLRTYSRPKANGEQEQWFETCRRVVEGCYRMQERHIKSQNLGWNEHRAQKSAQEMYERMFQMKWLPPGRGLWAMGSVLTEEKGLFASLNNCGFTSTEEIDKEPFAPFLFLMDMSMLGVGVGFDTEGAGRLVIREPGSAETRTGRWKRYYPYLPEREEAIDWKGNPVTFDYEVRDNIFRVPDTREGWVISVLYILDAFFTGAKLPQFNYDQVRPENLPLKGFGGVSSGPDPLKELHHRLVAFLWNYVGRAIDSEAITTIMNVEGKCVVMGNVRRSAEIAFGRPNDEVFLNLKDYRWDNETGQYAGPRADRADFGWTSNNSIYARVGMNYRRHAEQTGKNGEPGYAWLENMRSYSRMVDPPDNKDRRAKGGNPCLEQTLESFELCCLVETFIARHDSLEDYLRTLKFAYLYAKTVTLGKTHWAETNKVMLRNRRIGCSMSGLQQFVHVHGLDALRQWCEAGYQKICHWDEIYSDWFCVPESIKKTSIKPSGTVSLLAGATPGMHWPENVCYIRRIRLAADSDLSKAMAAAGYHVERDVLDPSSDVVEIPVKLDVPVRPVHQVSIWEQVAMAAFLQRYWADNQVSCLTADTIVRTTKGLVRMGELPYVLGLKPQFFGAQPYEGPVKILDGDGNWSTLSHLIINPPAPIVRIRMEGGQELRGTGDHEVQVLGENLEIVWKPLGEVTTGDYLVEKLNQPSYPSSSQLLARRMEAFDRRAGTCGDNSITIPTCMTEELAEFLGYMASDGHLGFTNGEVGLTQQRNNVVDRFVLLCERLFGITNLKVEEDPRPAGLLRVIRSSVVLNEWLQWIGLYDEEQRKRVPWVVLAAGERCIKAFLRGITLDGHVVKTNGRIVAATTCSYPMAEEICQLLKIIGFQPGLFTASDGGERTFPHGGTYTCMPTWNVSLSPDQSSRFARMIGFAEERKGREYHEFGNKWRHSLFGGVPDRGLRQKMAQISRRCSSHFLKDHFHSASLHVGKEVSRESLLQMRDMGLEIQEHLVSQENAFRRVIAVQIEEPEVTYDLTVPGAHSYVSNGFVSHNCTVTFDPRTEADQIEHVLDYFQYHLKGISFLPKMEGGAYAQMPYEEISEARYRELVQGLKPVAWGAVSEEERQLERFCDGGACTIAQA